MTSVNNRLPYLRVESECIACEWCKYNCPIDNCITFHTMIATIHHELCIECDRCVYVCPIDVIVPLRDARHLKMWEGSG